MTYITEVVRRLKALLLMGERWTRTTAPPAKHAMEFGKSS